MLAAIPCDDAVSRTGSGVVALGALPFDRMLEGHLIIPRFTMGIGRDADGETHRWATAIGPTDQPLPTTDELFDSVIWQYGTSPDGSQLADVHISTLETPLPTADHAAMVQRAADIMRAPGAELRKVVLSRTVTAHLDGPLPLSSVLRRLRSHEPELHDLLPPGTRGHLLRRLARTPDRPIRAPHQLSPVGRHHRTR